MHSIQPSVNPFLIRLLCAGWLLLPSPCSLAGDAYYLGPLPVQTSFYNNTLDLSVYLGREAQELRSDQYLLHFYLREGITVPELMEQMSSASNSYNPAGHVWLETQAYFVSLHGTPGQGVEYQRPTRICLENKPCRRQRACEEVQCIGAALAKGQLLEDFRDREHRYLLYSKLVQASRQDVDQINRTIARHIGGYRVAPGAARHSQMALPTAGLKPIYRYASIRQEVTPGQHPKELNCVHSVLLSLRSIGKPIHIHGVNGRETTELLLQSGKLAACVGSAVGAASSLAFWGSAFAGVAPITALQGIGSWAILAGSSSTVLTATAGEAASTAVVGSIYSGVWVGGCSLIGSTATGALMGAAAIAAPVALGGAACCGAWRAGKKIHALCTAPKPGANPTGYKAWVIPSWAFNVLPEGHRELWVHKYVRP